MRETKFRAWDSWWGKMYYFDFTKNIKATPDNELKGLWILHEESSVYAIQDKIKIMQFTGLHDKNGAEIYEGDILELINDSGRRILAICKFGSRRLRTKNRDMIDIQCFYFEVEGRKTNPMVCNYKGVHDLEIMEVIGNIYDNPELLESEEQKC